ncbi:MAG: hypothetical protein KGL39_23020 [Patescibacteria group bacterium]|nr:hypothetical protein [Patescibacteria group bacterium]
MAGFHTRAFDAQDQLVSLLQDAAAVSGSPLAKFNIGFGLPSRRDEQHVWVDEQLEGWGQESETSGLAGRVESFKIKTYIYVRSTGADAKEMRDQVKPVADAVADVIGSAPFLGETVMFASIIESEYDSAFADAQGKSREAVLMLGIGCSAYIA